MQAILQAHLPIASPQISLVKGLGWGMNGGFIATLVMDLILVCGFAAAGLPPFSCYSIIGDTLARLFSIQAVGTSGRIALGIAAHYLIGPALGGMFGALMVRASARRLLTRKKGVVIAVLYVEILSQPLLALAPILLRMTASDTLQWFGGSFVMHLVWGCVLGLICSKERILP